MIDPISDMLARLRNASLARKSFVLVPYSKIKESILRVMLNEGFIDSFQVQSFNKESFRSLVVYLRFLSKGNSVIEKIQRISKPGIRVYIKQSDLNFSRFGMGISIISTSHGVMSNREAKLKHLGGELLCEVW